MVDVPPKKTRGTTRRSQGLTLRPHRRWQQWVRRQMAELGLTQDELAEAVGATPAALSQLLTDDFDIKPDKESRLITRINERLEGIRPYQIILADEEDDPRRARILAALNDLDDDGYEALADLAALLTKKKKDKARHN